MSTVFAHCQDRRANGKPCNIDARGYCKACNAVRCGIHAPLNACNRCRTQLVPLRVFASNEDLMVTLYPKLRKYA